MSESAVPGSALRTASSARPSLKDPDIIAMPTTMALSRRQALWRAAGLLAAWPGGGFAAEAGPPAREGAADCLLAVTRLRRGRRVDDPMGEGGGCGAAPGAPAIFQAASLSKPVVATLALQLALRGTLDLDRPVSELLPDGYAHRQNLFALRAPPVVDTVPRELLRKITPRQLLSHTAGLPLWADRGPLQFTAEPGARWQYSGEGYVLLQHVLQALTGQALDALASSALFEPLGLRHTAFKLTDALEPWLVPGRNAAGQVRQLRFPYEIASSSLYTSAPDYARFIQATLEDGRLLELITQSPVPVPGVRGVHWGLGWGIEQPVPDRRYLWHWGNNPGFRALAMAEPSSKDAVVALAASEAGMPDAKAALNQVFPGAHPGLGMKQVE